MEEIDPRMVVAGSDLILDHAGAWPNFHDAEIIDLHFWQGDVRPEQDVYVGPQITATLKLCALQFPIVTVLKFENCDAIRMPEFSGQNPIMDLQFGMEERGTMNDGTPLTPYILVHFLPAFGFELSFKCFQVSVLSARPAPREGGDEQAVTRPG